MNNHTVAFIGAGNMARCLIGSLIADGYDPQKIWVSNPSQEKLQHLQTQFGLHTTQDNNDAVKHADIIILAVKPQVISAVAKEIAESVRAKKPLILSLAGAISHAKLLSWFDRGTAIVRCMPNTPVLVGSGATGLHANDNVTNDQKDVAESMMRAGGMTCWLDRESQLDIVTVLSGCGPAYFFLIMDVLEKAAVEQGLDEKNAHLLTLQTILGAANMAMQSSESIEILRKQVTSPGGITEKAVEVLQNSDIQGIFANALEAGRERITELSSINGES